MNQDNELAVFVYGSLQPGGRNWARYCEGKVVAQERAQVRGKLFRLRAPFPAVLLDDHHWTQGWRLVLRDGDVLRWFDELENFAAARPPEQNEYQRVRTECFVEANSSAALKSLGTAWIYVMTPERIAAEGGAYIPSGIWQEP